MVIYEKTVVKDGNLPHHIFRNVFFLNFAAYSIIRTSYKVHGYFMVCPFSFFSKKKLLQG